MGSDEAGDVHPVEVSLKFIEDTGVYAFAPAIGTAHGLYASSPKLTPERVTAMSSGADSPGAARRNRPVTEQFKDLISRGCAKVNISTALKIAFVDSFREYLEANPTKHDPPEERERRGAGDGHRAHADLRLRGQGAHSRSG